jgi:hypothetical protein
MCGCTAGAGGASSAWTPGGRLRYQVISNGFAVSYGSEADAKRHQAAHGGEIKIVTPGSRR